MVASPECRRAIIHPLTGPASGVDGIPPRGRGSVCVGTQFAATGQRRMESDAGDRHRGRWGTPVPDRLS